MHFDTGPQSQTVTPHHRFADTDLRSLVLSPMHRITIENKHQTAGISFGLLVSAHASIGPVNMCRSTNRQAP